MCRVDDRTLGWDGRRAREWVTLLLSDHLWSCVGELEVMSVRLIRKRKSWSTLSVFASGIERKEKEREGF